MIPTPLEIIVALDPMGRAVMKRDMELVREILLAIQDRTSLKGAPLILDGRDEAVVGRHLEMMFHAGLVDGTSSQALSSTYAKVYVRDLTWAGHDFLSALENKGVWGKIKQTFSASELASMPLDVLKDLGIGLLKQYAKSKVGLSVD